MKNRKAFTLVEALIVVAIIGIMVTVALPAFNRFYQMFKFRTAMNQIVTDMRSARQAAITNGRPVKLSFIKLSDFPEIRGMTGGYAFYMLATTNDDDMAAIANWRELAPMRRVCGMRPERPRFLAQPVLIDTGTALLGDIETDDPDTTKDLVFLADGSLYAGEYPYDSGGGKIQFKDDPTGHTDSSPKLSPSFTMKTTRSTTFDRYTVYFSLFGKISVYPYHS